MKHKKRRTFILWVLFKGMSIQLGYFLQITLGRTAKGQKVDVDLKLEGPAWKISRRQGVIKLKNSGEFYIANEGKRSIFVDGKPVSVLYFLKYLFYGWFKY